MAHFAADLQGWAPNSVSKPVIDMSNLAGAWNFMFMWTGLAEINGRVNARQPGDKEEALKPVGSMTVFESLERLGIKLVDQKHPMPVWSSTTWSRHPPKTDRCRAGLTGGIEVALRKAATLGRHSGPPTNVSSTRRGPCVPDRHVRGCGR